MFKKVQAVLFTAAICTLLPTAGAKAQIPSDFAVPVTATIRTDSTWITLHWPKAANATGYIVYRRTDPTALFKQYSLNATDTGFTDTLVTPGVRYEYKVTKFFVEHNDSYSGDGVIETGIDLTMPEMHGTALIIVEDSISQFLGTAIHDFENDLMGDGWCVRTIGVGKHDPPPSVKAKIAAVRSEATPALTSVILIGHVPVPYSGDIAPDDHTPGFGNHQGAWAADVYYADLDGTWTDNSVNDLTADRLENRNSPGDGKFDQNTIPGKAVLQVGRIDLSNLPSFAEDEATLLRKYLDKDHRYRTRELDAPKRGLVFDSFYVLEANDVPATNGFRNFGTLFGPESVDAREYIDLRTTPYLWSYGCGGGTWFAAAGIGATWDIAKYGSKSIFTMIFGSFFGDWDSQDDLLRAPLATDYGLVSAWAGRPYWYLYPLAAGQTIGYATQLTQNYVGLPTSKATRGIHVALMGDPTLRMYYGPQPVTIGTADMSSGNLAVSWDLTDAQSYNFYMAKNRSEAMAGHWTKISTGSHNAVIVPNHVQDHVFLVRPVGIAMSPAASYTEIGQGFIYETEGAESVTRTPERIAATFDPERRLLTILAHGEIIATAYDLLGKSYPLAATGSSLDLHALRVGVYFVEIRTGDTRQVVKVQIVE